MATEAELATTALNELRRIAAEVNADNLGPGYFADMVQTLVEQLGIELNTGNW